MGVGGWGLGATKQTEEKLKEKKEKKTKKKRAVIRGHRVSTSNKKGVAVRGGRVQLLVFKMFEENRETF